MALPPRQSSLQSLRSSGRRFSSSTISHASQNPQQSIESQITYAESDLSTDDQDERTGFATPSSDSEKTLVYSYPPSTYSNHKIPNKPLIHYTHNHWRKGSTIGTGEQDDDLLPEGWQELICSRAFKRWMLLYFIIMGSALIWWFKFYTPAQELSIASKFMVDSLKGRFLDDSEWGYFGTNKRVEFAGMVHLKTLDRKLVPGSDVAGEQRRRLIVVGDIHGCAEELQTLLDQVSFNPSTDHLISTGDMISKGQSSSKVVDILMSHKASCVRGNNEDRVLHAYRDHHSPSHQKVLAAQRSLSESSVVPLKHGHRKDLALAASLSAEQVSYLTACPVILNLGTIPGMGSNVSVVHAGLVPGVKLEKQDPSAVMTMRSIDLRNHVPSSRRAPDPAKGPPPRPRNRARKPDYSEWDAMGRLAVLPWGDVWDNFQDLIPILHEEGLKLEQSAASSSPPPSPKASSKKKQSARQPPHGNPYKHLSQSSVIYGHDSHAGVVQGKWHTGLDGGCFRGGNLAALIIEETGFIKGLAGKHVKRSIVRVPCRDWTDQGSNVAGSAAAAGG